MLPASCRQLRASSPRSAELLRRRSLLASHCARFQWNRLKTGNRNWNGFVHGRAEHFLSIGRTAATARRHWAFVIEIVADSIRIEHLRGNELPANVAKTVTQSEFEADIDSETVRERQRPAGFLHDGPLVSAGNQERTEAEKKKGLQSHERLGCFRNQRFSPAIKFSISANAEAISKSGHIP